jgi:hypothetical protein
MPRGHSEAVVTKFLRHALAAHALGVTELEISRRKVPADRVWGSQPVALANAPAAAERVGRYAAGAGASTSHSSRLGRGVEGATG